MLFISTHYQLFYNKEVIYFFTYLADIVVALLVTYICILNRNLRPDKQKQDLCIRTHCN